MWIKKMYVVSRFFNGKTPVGILRNEKATTKGMLKTNKQTSDNKQSRFRLSKNQGKSSAHGSHFFVNFFAHTAQEIRLRGSQWGGGLYSYRLKFWLFYGYRLIFFSYG